MRHGHPQSVRGGAWTLASLTYLMLLPFAMIGVAVRARMTRLRQTDEVAALRTEIAEIQARLDTPVSPAPVDLRLPLAAFALMTVPPFMLVVINLLR